MSADLPRRALVRRHPGAGGVRRSGPLTALRSGESLDASAGNGNVRERLRARCFRMGEVELRREHVERASAATR